VFKNGIANVYLIGFMGVGKSTVGPVLAELWGYSFLDTDSVIEEKTGMKISSLFREKGEQHFRDIESEVIRPVSKFSNHVVALGGGAVLRKENWDAIQASGRVIYLRASVQTLYARLVNTLENRPLLSHLTQKEMIIEIQNVLQKRSSFYERALLQVDTDEKTVREVVSEIMSLQPVRRYRESALRIS